MNMKVTAVLVLAIALVATLMFSLQQEQGPEQSPLIETTDTDDLSPSTPQQVLPKQPDQAAPTEEEEEKEPVEVQIAQTKAKLDALMLEYNENLKNPQAKKELETQIALLMDEYNALILPIAVEKVKQTNLPKT